MNEIIQEIEIDLPSEEDFKSLANARFEEFKRSTYNDEYKYNYSTHLAILTGKARYSENFYLKDLKKNDTYNIRYTFIDSIVDSDITNADKMQNFNRYNRHFLIRPVINLSNNSLFDKLKIPKENSEGEKLNYAKIYLGSSPRYAVSKNIQYKLNMAYKKHLLVKTDDKFTYDSIYVHGDRNLKKHFKPIEYPVYEYEGKKFIQFKVFNCYTSNDSITLTDDVKYHNGEYVWLEVSQIPWIVDIKRKVLIAQEGLLSGIQYENYNKEFNPIDYCKSNIKWYLDNIMKYEILKNEPLLIKEAKNMINKKKVDTSKTNRITDIINNIKEYEKYYLGNIDVKKKVQQLLSNYNNELDNLSRNINNKKSELSIEFKSPEFCYQKLITDLEEILFELKIHGEKVKNYYDMIKILNECQKDVIDVNKDEICANINTIKHTILPFIADSNIREKLTSELNTIIIRNIMRNKSYIEEFKYNDNIKIKQLNELKNEFRKDLQPFLEDKLCKTIKKQDTVNDIMSNIKMMIDNHFIESKNKIVKNYLNILNNAITDIKENGTENDIKRLNEIITLDFDLNNDENMIIKKVESMIIEAYKIKLDIEERQSNNKKITDLKINIDIESIFEDNEKTK